MASWEHHRDVALKLLVSRSLDGWPGEEDQRRIWVMEERLLWAELGPREQSIEQEFLGKLWQMKPEERWVDIKPEWGCPRERVLIPNQAFGLPEHAHRPVGLAVGEAEKWGVGEIVRWVQSKGFLVVEVGEGGILLRLPAHRVSQESDRFLVLLCRRYPHFRERMVPGVDGAITIRAFYDPIGGMASLRVKGLVDVGGAT